MLAQSEMSAAQAPIARSEGSLPATLARLVTEAAEALESDHDAARALLLKATLLLQSGKVGSLREPRRPAEATLAPWRARQVANHIDDNLDRSLSLRELARVAGLSSSYFSRAFKGAFGATPHALIIDRRIARAKKEMLESDQPLAQIALSCGFSDQAHLARLFRRSMGVSPGEWRRANRCRVDPECGAASGTHGVL
jgi:AraC family transcriptional regulator